MAVQPPVYKKLTDVGHDDGMSKKILRSNAVYAIQNGLAACLFLLLFVGEGSAYLLNAFPTSELVWRISLTVNHIVGPILEIGDELFQLPFLLLGILASAVVLPGLAYLYRNWFATAVSGHMALGAAVFITLKSLMQVGRDHSVASLSAVFDTSILSPTAWSLCAITSVMAVFCILNHAMFFARAGARNHRLCINQIIAPL